MHAGRLAFDDRSIHILQHTRSTRSSTSVLALSSPLLLSTMSQIISGLGIAVVAFYIGQRMQMKPAPAAPSAAASPVAPAAAAAASAASSTPAAKAVASRRAVKDDKLKMVLLVRNDLGMGKGKMCAQCCHAAVGVVRDMLDGSDADRAIVDSWEENGAMKVALKVGSEEELVDMEARAEKEGLHCYLVVDAGHTQIAPDTRTVLAIGPAPVKILDKITGHLKLIFCRASTSMVGPTVPAGKTTAAS